MKTPQSTYTTFFIKEKLGIKVDRLKDWMKRGYIIPSIKEADGTGTKNIFSLDDLYLIKLFEYLADKKGFSRSDAEQRIRSIKIYLNVADDYDRIKKTKLNDEGLKKIRDKWKDLSKIDFLVFYWIEDEKEVSKTLNTPLKVDAVILQKESANESPEIDWEGFFKSDDILIVNFKKIRKQVDTAVG